jgi:HAD superfamily hydrolase (TIGR01662 family)
MKIQAMLIIFDKNGTLVEEDSQEFRPGVLDKIGVLGERNILAVASDESGVAMGEITLEQATERVEAVALAIGATAWRLCPHHPFGRIAEYRLDSWCRKPNPGMLYEIAEELAQEPEFCLFVGDSSEDYRAAIAAGMRFAWDYEIFL